MRPDPPDDASVELPVTGSRAPAPAVAERRPAGGRRRWLSGRALLIHAVGLLVFALCLTAAWWQVDRALSGNVLSFVYAVEWPAFAGITAWGWWQLIHMEPDPLARPAPEPPRWVRWDRDEESPELRSYNDYLLELHRSGHERPARELRRGRRLALAAGEAARRADERASPPGRV